MRLWRALCGMLLVVGSVVGITVAAPSAGAATASVLMVGDSTMRGMGAAAQDTIRAAYELAFDSGSCRRLIVASCKPIPNAIDVIRANPGRDAIVIMTGYNDWKVGDAVDVVMAEAARQGVQTVIWLTYRTDIAEGAQKPIAISAVFRDHNVELAQKAPLYPNLRVVDWDGYSAGRDDWFAWDGFHLSSAGGFALAGLLRTTLDGLRLARCHAAPGGTTGPGPGAQPVPATEVAPGGLALMGARRLLDTRAGAPLGAGRSVAVSTAGAVPGGATSVLVNVAAVESCGPGFLTVYPCGPVPNTSNLNTGMRTTVANLAAVAVDGQGQICVYSWRQTDVIVDLVGVFGPGGALFNQTAPERVVDTRAPGAARLGQVGQLPAGATISLALRGAGALPRAADAVAANVTVLGAAAPGFVTVFPCGPVPATSNLNFPAGRAVANLVVTPLAADGSLCVRSSVAAHLLVDVVGWFGPDGQRFQVVTPERVVDTRSGLGAPRAKVGRGGTLTMALGAPSMLNVTAVSPSAPGFVTAFPCGPQPVVSTLNYVGGQTVPNLAIVGVTGGQACLASDQTTDLVVDRLGTFVP